MAWYSFTNSTLCGFLKFKNLTLFNYKVEFLNYYKLNLNK